MLYNYLKVILRNFISDGMYTFIIIFGLAIGLASILVIGQYIYFELSFDQHVKDKDRIYYTYLNWQGEEKGVDAQCFPAVAPFMDASIPEVESSVRLLNTTAIRRQQPPCYGERKMEGCYFTARLTNCFWQILQC